MDKQYYPVAGTRDLEFPNVNYSLAFDDNGRLYVRVLDPSTKIYKYIPVTMDRPDMDEDDPLATEELDGWMSHEDKKYINTLSDKLSSIDGGLYLVDRVLEAISTIDDYETYLGVTLDGVSHKVLRSEEGSTKYLISTSTESGSRVSVVDMRDVVKSSLSDVGSFLSSTVVDQTSEDFTVKSTLSGGSNLVSNSSWIQGLQGWDISGVASTTHAESIPNSSSTSSVISPRNSSFKLMQYISTEALGTYTISIVIDSDTIGTKYNWVGVRIFHNNTLVDEIGTGSSTNGYKQFSKTITLGNGMTSIRLEVVSEQNSNSKISSLLVLPGSLVREWETGIDEETSTTMTHSLSGIEVSNDYSSMTRVSSNGVSGYSISEDVMEQLFSITSDESILSKLNLDKELSMGNIKIVPVDGRNSKGIGFFRS